MAEYVEYSIAIAIMPALPDLTLYIVLFVNYFMNESNPIVNKLGD
jgi:hypothetical protein